MDSTNLKQTVTFKDGGQGSMIGFTQKKIVIAPKEISSSIEAGIPYVCLLKPTRKGNGFIVEKADRVPTIKASLFFRLGKENDKMVSAHEGKIVLANLELIKDPAEYECEFFLSGKGTAYIVATAKKIPPYEVEIVYDPFPSYSVEVKQKVTGRVISDLSFCADDASQGVKVEYRVKDFRKKNFLNMSEASKEYEKLCNRAISESQSRSYAKNRQNL